MAARPPLAPRCWLMAVLVALHLLTGDGAGHGAAACPAALQPVIIYHTHGQETYPAPREVGEQAELSILSVGAQLANALRQQGLPVVHSRRRHDLPRRTEAYDRSRRTVTALLQHYPQTPLVVDLHRDAPGRSQTVGRNRAGRPTARLLFVVGRHAGQAESRRLAETLMEQLIALEPDLNRGLRQLRYHYHQDLAPSVLLVELGGADTFADEALRGVTVLAEVITAYLCTEAGPGLHRGSAV